MLDEEARLGRGIGAEFPDVAVPVGVLVGQAVEQILIVQPFDLVIDAALFQEHRFLTRCQVKKGYVPVSGQRPTNVLLISDPGAVR